MTECDNRQTPLATRGHVPRAENAWLLKFWLLPWTGLPAGYHAFPVDYVSTESLRPNNRQGREPPSSQAPAPARALRRRSSRNSPLTQSQLFHAVAGATGESVAAIEQRGFGLVASHPGDLEPGDLRFVLDCPFCGHLVAHPGTVPGGALALAECLRCDVYFDFAEKEVYAVEVDDRGQVMSPVA